MNKIGERDYVKLIADTLVENYGSTLKEYGKDVKMAEAVVNAMREFLYFHTMDMSKKEYKKWKRERDPKNN